MAPRTSNTDPDSLDDSKNPFGSKPANLMVWIIPSVVLHVIAVAVWLSMPEEKPREVREKKLSIKSEQAEKLQEFVEDANLRELRAEVTRLQEIKRTMAALRSEGIRALAASEGENQQFVNADAVKALTELQDSLSGLIRGQEDVIDAMRRINSVFVEITPLIEDKDLAALIPHARRMQDLRNGLQGKQEELNKQFLLLRARLDTSDGVMSLANAPEIDRMWENFFQLQERALGSQSGCSDRLDQIQIKQGEALKRIVTDGTTFELKQQQMLDQAKNAQAKFEMAANNIAKELEKSAVAEKEMETKLTTLTSKLQGLRDEKGALMKERTKLGNSPDAATARQAIQQKSVDLDRQIQALSREKSNADSQFRNIRKARANVEVASKRLKQPPPHNPKERERMLASMNQSLLALSEKGGDLASQENALKLNLEALQMNRELIQMIEQKESK